MSSITQKITEAGQSLWLDNIQRRTLDSGELNELIEQSDIRGMTSNPTIFKNAISNSNDYDTALTSLAWAGWDAEKIYWELAIEDIKHACDLFMPVFEHTNGVDGFVSLEESPAIAHDTQLAIVQAQQLWARVARRNLFIKIPATPEGIPAIRKSLAAGININITLIFALKRYDEVIEAFLGALEDRLAAGQPIDYLASVASFFVSRVDTKIDDWLEESSTLRGKAAIANAKLAYEIFQKAFSGERWEKLAAQGARLQRPLWASTSTKNPTYPDTLYVDELIGPNTINTLPPQTLDAVRDHGKSEITITQRVEEARRTLEALEAHDISMAKATRELEDEGVKAFAESFDSLIKTIDERRKKALGELGPLAQNVSEAIARLEKNSVLKRLWNHDPTLWSGEPASAKEIRNRLGWLSLPETSGKIAREISVFTKEIRRTGIRKFLLIGMGGSSLAPEVFSKVIPPTNCEFAILDSTDPEQISETAKKFPASETLYVISSKSGGTLEVNALYDYFWDLAKGDGSHFIAITDPDTTLDHLAKQRKFRKTFHADPNVGGRYSAFTAFGLVPAALMGFDLDDLLDNVEWMRKQCSADRPAARNPGLTLGAVLGAATLSGRNKLTINADPSLLSFGSWLEQLIAESSGKQGKGILPVDHEALAQPELYGKDRLFIYLRNSAENDQFLNKIREAGHPVITVQMGEPKSLFAEMYRWEFAIAIACHMIGVNAFDQPNVQESKDSTQEAINQYQSKRRMEFPEPILENENLKLYSRMNLIGTSLEDLLAAFISTTREADFIAINAFLPRTEKTAENLGKLRQALRSRTKCTTTVGFGPRFLHSTGQFHKGGTNQGLYLMITSDARQDIQIPTQELTFGLLEKAQALGDYEALNAHDRRVLWTALSGQDVLRTLVEAINKIN